MSIEELDGGGTQAEARPAPRRPGHAAWLVPVTAVLALAAGFALGQGAADMDDPVASPSPAPTPYPLAGTIVFGPLASPESTVRFDQDLAWSAILSEPVDSNRVDVVISPVGTDTELFGYTQIVSPGTLVTGQEMPVGRFIREPGTYVMRYLSTRNGDVLAEGEFELVQASSD